MKSLATSLAIAALALIGAAPQADARHSRGCPPSRTYISGYASCGSPIYTERYFIRYDHCGRVIWGYRTLPVRRVYHPAPRYVRRDACHGGGGYDRRHSGGAVTISGTFYR